MGVVGFYFFLGIGSGGDVWVRDQFDDFFFFDFDMNQMIGFEMGYGF